MLFPVPADTELSGDSAVEEVAIETVWKRAPIEVGSGGC